MARLIGIRHLEIDTDELSLPQYAENAPDRCYHCKTELYLQIKDLQQSLQVDVIVNGANADDLFDYRPGHACRHRTGGAQSVGRVWSDQERSAGAGQVLGAADLGQTGDTLSVQPHCLRRSGDGGTFVHDRSRGAVPARSRVFPRCVCGTTRGIWPASKSPWPICPGCCRRICGPR